MADPIEQKTTELTPEQLVAQGQAAAQSVDLAAIAKEQADFEADVRKKLRENGKLLGLNFGPNTSVQSMHEQLMAAREQLTQDSDDLAEEKDLPVSEAQFRANLRQENMKLVRIRIACLNPAKAGLPGEILSVHNDIVGTVKKYIPYNEAGEAYHVPMILFKMLKRKKFLQIVQPPKGSHAPPTTKMAPEYGIEVLPQLTPKEIEDLKRAQGAAKSSDNEE
jgi:hypothetical protein